MALCEEFCGLFGAGRRVTGKAERPEEKKSFLDADELGGSSRSLFLSQGSALKPAFSNLHRASCSGSLGGAKAF